MSERTKSALLAVVVVAAVVVFVAVQVVVDVSGNPTASLARKAGHLALFLVFWLGVYGVGRTTAALLLGRKASPPPELSAALGVVAFVYLGFIMCAAHAAYPWVARVFVVAAAVGTGFLWRREWGRAAGRVRRWREEVELPTAALALGAGVLALPVALTAAHPPTYVDALVYHLAVPKAYAAAHGFVYLPYNAFSSMPMGGSLFYVWPYLWDGVITANASHLVVTVLALALTYRLARRWLDQFYSALAAVLVILTPVAFKVMGGGHNDHFLMLFVVAALYVYFDAGAPGGTARRRSFLGAGLLLGAALAVKYSAVAALGAFIPVLGYDLLKKRIRWAEAAVFLVAAAAPVAPWLVKAYVERGNPVFPLAYDWFPNRDFSAEQARRLVEWQSDMGRGRGVWDYLLLPYRISVAGGFDYKDFAGRYLPFLLPLAALAAASFRRAGRVVAFAWVYLAAWALGPQQLRFLDGALPAFAVAAAGTLAAVDRDWATWGRRAWRFGVSASTFAVALPFLIAPIFSSMPRQTYLTGVMDAPAFLREWTTFYRTQEYANENLPADARVLLLYYNENLYLEREAVYDSFLEASAIMAAAVEAPDEAAFRETVRRWGVTHVHLNLYGESWMAGRYPDVARERIRAFLYRYGVVIYEDKHNVLFELVDPAAS